MQNQQQGNNGRVQNLLWNAVVIAVCVTVSTFLFYVGCSMAETRACGIEKEVEYKFEILYKEVQDMRADFREFKKIYEKH